MRYGDSLNSSDGARVGITIRALLFLSCASSSVFFFFFFGNYVLLHAALKSHLFKWEYPSEIHTGETKANGLWLSIIIIITKTPLAHNWKHGCPRTSYGAERGPFHKSRRSSYLEMKLLTRLERSAASPAVTRPLHTHAHARAHTHTHTHTLSHIHREELRLWNGRYCVNGCQLWTTVFSIFTLRHFLRMRVGEGGG